MDNQRLIEYCIDKEFETLFKEKNPDVYKFLVEHERKHVAVERLAQEVRICELNPNITMTQDTVIELAIDIARMFARRAMEVKEHEINSAEQRILEEAARKAQLKEEEMQQEIDGRSVRELHDREEVNGPE